MLPWRHQLGIWAAVAAVAHTILVLIGWVRWDVARFLGFEFVPQLGRQARIGAGFRAGQHQGSRRGGDAGGAGWFRLPLVALGGLVLALQWAAFVVSVRRRRAGRSLAA